MNIEKVNINIVLPNTDNPRTIKDHNFKKLVKSIREFPRMLEARPIVVDDNMVVLGGNMRLKACIAADLTEVYILKFNNLTPEQRKEFIIKDNVGYGDWDFDLLLDDYERQDLLDWGLDLPKEEEELIQTTEIQNISALYIDCKQEDKQEDLFNKLIELGYVNDDIKFMNFEIDKVPNKEIIKDESQIKYENKKLEFKIDRINKTNDSYNVKYILDKFDMEKTNKQTFKGLIDLDFDWNVGLIVGNSGTGKTTISKELFGEDYITEFEYDNNAIIDNFGDTDINTIINTLTSVGLASTTTWLKPYNVLSGGEKMRCDLASSLLSNKELIVFDEFTSVVDRNIAKIGSFIIQKNIRRNNKKFIAVGCHFDVEDWLMPDWVFDTNKMEFLKLDVKKKSDQTSTLKLENVKERIRKKLGTSFQNTII